MGLFGWLFGSKSSSKSSSRSASEQQKFRKQALNNSVKDPYGNIQDPYTGKHHKAKSMDADHIFPHSKGGSNDAWNSAMTHKSYNRSKSNKIRTADLAKGYSRNKQVRSATKKAATVAGVAAAVASSFDY